MKSGIVVILSFCLLFFSCKTMKNNIGKNFPVGDHYEDYVSSDNIYKNSDLNLSIPFNEKWTLKNQYRHFDSFEKMFVDQFNSESSEVLFIGYNDEDKCGVRCFVSELGMKNQDYFEKLKAQESVTLGKYKIDYSTTEDLELKNFECYHTVMELTLNANNIFIYDSIFFKDTIYNFRLDFWCTKENYKVQKEVFNNFFNGVELNPAGNNVKKIFNSENGNEQDITTVLEGGEEQE